MLTSGWPRLGHLGREDRVRDGHGLRKAAGQGGTVPSPLAWFPHPQRTAAPRISSRMAVLSPYAVASIYNGLTPFVHLARPSSPLNLHCPCLQGIFNFHPSRPGAVHPLPPAPQYLVPLALHTLQTFFPVPMSCNLFYKDLKMKCIESNRPGLLQGPRHERQDG